MIKQFHIEKTTRQFKKFVYTRTYYTILYYIVQGTLLNVMWKPGWEGSLGQNGYMYTYG